MVFFWLQSLDSCDSELELCQLHEGAIASCTVNIVYRGADKSLARPGRKQATTAEDFEFHISYL